MKKYVLFIVLAIVTVGIFDIAVGQVTGNIVSSRVAKEGIKAYCIDFNWGPGGPNAFTAPGVWADADPKEHVAWYKSLGANVIQTFAVSCNGYAWYKNGVVPEQPGLKHDFLAEMVRLGHAEEMMVMGYFCVGANTRWGQLHPDQSYGIPAGGHIPLTKKYNAYLCSAVTDALKKTNMDGFMLDWFFHGPIRKTQIKWLDCEIQMWSELMDGPFPGKGEVTEKQELEFARRSVDRCWRQVRAAAKSAKPRCIIWLSMYSLNHPQVVDSRLVKEVDWLMNEGGTVEDLKRVRKELGRGNLLNCLARWNRADPRTVVPASIKAGFGLYGFTRPIKGSLLPSVDDYYLAKDLDDLTGDEANIAMLARAYRGIAVTATTLASAAGSKDAKKIVFVHGKASHGYGGHAYGPAFRMLARILNEKVPAVTAVVVQDNADLAVLDTADAIVLGSDGGRLVKSLGDRLEPLMEKGVGLACIHYTVDPGDPKAVARLIDWIGGAYEQHWSVNPHWEADFTTFPDHPVARGLEPFKAQDEWYYHMRFAKDMKGVTPILSAVPPESTRQRRDGPHSGNPHVRARKGMAEVVGWVYERPGGGRGFGFTGMHTHWTWAQDSYRKSVLNALVWIAGAEVPAGGVPSKTPTLEELEADLGVPRPKNFNADAIRERIKSK